MMRHHLPHAPHADVGSPREDDASAATFAACIPWCTLFDTRAHCCPRPHSPVTAHGEGADSASRRPLTPELYRRSDDMKRPHIHLQLMLARG